MSAVEDYLLCSPSISFNLTLLSHFLQFTPELRPRMLSLWKRPVEKSKRHSPSSSRPPLPKSFSSNPRLTQQELTIQDPNGALIYDMMANRSLRWRDKHLRPSILPPGWKMGISRLGRVPVYDPLYEPLPPALPPRLPVVMMQDRMEEMPVAVRRRGEMIGRGREPVVPPRYQPTDPQYDFATDEYNLGLPPRLAQLFHENMRGRGGYGGGFSGRGGGRVPWVPPSLGGRGSVPVMMDDVFDDALLEEEVLDPGLDILESQPLPPRRKPFPPHGIHHRPSYGLPGHHRGGHRPGHGHGGYDRRSQDILEAELATEEMDREAAEIAALQREMDAQEARRREEELRRQESVRLHAEERAREEELRIRELVRERELELREAERLAEQLARHGHGHDHHDRHRGGPRVARDRNGRQVIVDEHPRHRELVHIPRDGLINRHHRDHLTHPLHPHHSPPRRRPAGNVHFSDDLSSEEERHRHHARLRQEQHPFAQRRRFDRVRTPYLHTRDELEYGREDLFDYDDAEFHEGYDSADEYYPAGERLLMPPRVIRGEWWEGYMDGDDN